MGERARGVRAVLGILVIAGTLAVSAAWPAETDAGWTGQQQASMTAAAMIVQPPVVTACTYSTGVLGLTPTATVTWHFPTGTPTYAMPGNASLAATAGDIAGNLLTGLVGGATQVTTPATGSAPSYSTVFTLPLLSGALSASYTVGVQTVYDGWTSGYASALATSTLAGLNPTCTIR